MTNKIRYGGEKGAERYRSWRATIPWTDDQIIEALRAWVNDPVFGDSCGFMRARREYRLEHFIRHRRLSSFLLTTALPYLVKFCELCGATALYRTGIAGRCRKHRFVPDQYVVARRQRLEAEAASLEQVRKQQDYQSLGYKMTKRGFRERLSKARHFGSDR